MPISSPTVLPLFNYPPKSDIWNDRPCWGPEQKLLLDTTISDASDPALDFLVCLTGFATQRGGPHIRRIALTGPAHPRLAADGAYRRACSAQLAALLAACPRLEVLRLETPGLCSPRVLGALCVHPEPALLALRLTVGAAERADACDIHEQILLQTGSLEVLEVVCAGGAVPPVYPPVVRQLVRSSAQTLTTLDLDMWGMKDMVPSETDAGTDGFPELTHLRVWEHLVTLGSFQPRSCQSLVLLFASLPSPDGMKKRMVDLAARFPNLRTLTLEIQEPGPMRTAEDVRDLPDLFPRLQELTICHHVRSLDDTSVLEINEKANRKQVAHWRKKNTALDAFFVQYAWKGVYCGTSEYRNIRSVASSEIAACFRRSTAAWFMPSPRAESVFVLDMENREIRKRYKPMAYRWLVSS